MPKKFIKSFKHARAGLRHAVRTQRNLWIHFFAALLILMVAWLIKVTFVELAILALTITLVLVAEMANTALEELVNILSPSHRQEAALAKDVAAAMVLTSTFGAVLVGTIIILPRLL